MGLVEKKKEEKGTWNGKTRVYLASIDGDRNY